MHIPAKGSLSQVFKLNLAIGLWWAYHSWSWTSQVIEIHFPFMSRGPVAAATYSTALQASFYSFIFSIYLDCIDSMWLYRVDTSTKWNMNASLKPVFFRDHEEEPSLTAGKSKLPRWIINFLPYNSNGSLSFWRQSSVSDCLVFGDCLW